MATLAQRVLKKKKDEESISEELTPEEQRAVDEAMQQMDEDAKKKPKKRARMVDVERAARNGTFGQGTYERAKDALGKVSSDGVVADVGMRVLRKMLFDF